MSDYPVGRATRPTLLRMIEDGVITGVKDIDRQVGAASIDLRLHNQLVLEMYAAAKDTQGGHGVVDLTKPKPSFTSATYALDDGESLLIRPGQFFLGASEEMFNLPDNVTACVMLRSTTARCGMNHMLAGFCDPGWFGSRLTFEFKNELQHHAIRIAAGITLAQLVIDVAPVSVEPKDSYAQRGRYNKDVVVSAAK